MRKEEFLALAEELKELLISASCAYADDTGSEWGSGNRLMRMFTEQVIKNKLTFYQIEYVYQLAEPLMSFTAVMDNVLRDAYKG
jgi:hypothetical protein